MNNRYRNYGLWVALFAFLPILAQSLGTYNINLVLPGNYADLTLALLGLLVLAGIINNPTTEDRGFKDDLL